MLKTLKWYNKIVNSGIQTFLFERKNTDLRIFKKIIYYAFSGFSILFIGYLLLTILNNYPPRELGVSL